MNPKRNNRSSSLSSKILFKTFPRESHLISVWYNKTSCIDPISLHKILNNLEFTARFFKKFTIVVTSLKISLSSEHVRRKTTQWIFCASGDTFCTSALNPEILPFYTISTYSYTFCPSKFILWKELIYFYKNINTKNINML